MADGSGNPGRTQQNDNTKGWLLNPQPWLFGQGGSYDESWPKIESAVQQLLSQEPGELIEVSFMDLYPCVYWSVMWQYSDRMYQDLRRVITNYLQKKADCLQELQQMCNVSEYSKKFQAVLEQYMQALGAIVSIFEYMNRDYITKRLHSDLRRELENLFLQHLESHISRVLALLDEEQAKPFSVDPSVASDIVHGLYALKPDLNPGVFARYIPSVLPPCSVKIL